MHKINCWSKRKHLPKLNLILDNPDTASKWFLVKNASTLPNLQNKNDERLNYFEINDK